MKNYTVNIKDKNFVLISLYLITGVASFIYLPLDAFKDVIQELIALFGLMMAAVLPTMVLTASVLRAGNLSPKKIAQYKEALFKQLEIWIGLFFISLIASLLLVVSKMLGWEAKYSLGVKIINCFIAVAIVLILIRAFAVAKGIKSLLNLSSEIALSEAREKLAVENEKAKAEIDKIASPASHQENIQIKL